MSVDQTGKPRAGKYCPRCHTMVVRDQAICPQCGHQFRSGAGPAAADTPSPEPDPLHRTMQFVMPPLAPRPATLLPREPAAGPLPYSRFPDSRRAVFAALLVALLLGFGLAAWIWHGQSRSAAEAVSPVGVWETTLRGKGAQGQGASEAHLEFAFQAGGTGQLAWRESGQTPVSGQTSLHWAQNADGKLALTLDKPVSEDAVSQTLVTVFSGHRWTWHVDSGSHELVLGTLVFTEKF